MLKTMYFIVMYESSNFRWIKFNTPLTIIVTGLAKKYVTHLNC